MSVGYLAIVLHSHLPYVLSHGRWPHGTDWLCEAAAETYLPILRVMNELVGGGFKPKLTVGLSPVLCEQLADQSFKDEFITYVDAKLEAAAQDHSEFTRYEQPDMVATAQMWAGFYGLTRKHFDSIDRDVISEYRKLQDDGHLEIITCGATHGYFPLLSRDESIQAQVKAAVKSYERMFGRKPRGIWLPECGYRPRYEWKPPVPIGGKQSSYVRKGVDELLSENDLEFFIIDQALLKGGKSQGVYIDRFDALKLLWHRFEENYHPRVEESERSSHEVYLVASAPGGKKPTAVFTRDPGTGLLVWSGDHGYPGDGQYLDFHKKRYPGGLRYWAVTASKADLADKTVYSHSAALERLAENSVHFAGKVEEILGKYESESSNNGILVAPYDAELFGHWWFEGPLFLKEVLKQVSRSGKVETTFLSEHLERVQPSKAVSLPEGSWGQGNHHYIWLNEQTEWTWKHVYECEAEMCRLARFWREHPDRRDRDLEVVLKQLGRELMLMSASDWQFLISTFAARDYAELRLTEHYQAFKRLAAIAERRIKGEEVSGGDWLFVDDCLGRDRLFVDFEIEWFASLDNPA